MTSHLPLQHPSLNPLSFQLTICLTPLYIVCSVESAVFINTSFCCFTSMWYCLQNCFLCVISAGSTNSGSSATATVTVGCTPELSCTGMHVYRFADGLTRWYAAFTADGGVNTGRGLGGPWGIAGQTQLWWRPARCEYNIQNCEVHTALLQMINRPRHEAETCFCGVLRLGMGGAVPLLLLSAFMVWGETNWVYRYWFMLSVASMALNVRMIGE